MEVRWDILVWDHLEQYTPLFKLGLEGEVMVTDTHNTRKVLCGFYLPPMTGICVNLGMKP